LPVGWRKGSLRECTPPLWDCRTRRSGPRPAAGVELSRPHRVRARCTRVTTPSAVRWWGGELLGVQAGATSAPGRPLRQWLAQAQGNGGHVMCFCVHQVRGRLTSSRGLLLEATE
jgi:hypothetical protein